MIGRIVALATLVLFAPAHTAAAPAPGLLVRPQQYENATPEYRFTVRYPRSDLAAIDAAITAWVREQVDGFADYTAADRQPGEGRPWSLDISYKVTRNDERMFQVWFTTAMNDDGNHTHFEFTTANFLMPDGWRVYLPEIIAPSGFRLLSRLAVTEADKAYPDIGVDTFRKAFAPVPESFRAFTVSKTSLILYFTGEEIAGPSAEPVAVAIPLARLKRVLRSDWRAPQPSFDCLEAVTPVEQSLCSDVALARLDREMAAAYRLWLTWHPDDAARLAAQREAQRAWLASREAACPGTPTPAVIACLKQAYEARIKALRKPPV